MMYVPDQDDVFIRQGVLIASNHLRRSVVIDVAGAEERLGVAGTVRRQFLKVVEQLLVDVAEIHLFLDVEQRLRLFGQDVVADVLLEAASELGNVLLLQGETDGIGVASEVEQQLSKATSSKGSRPSPGASSSST